MKKILIATALLTFSASTALASSNHHNNYGGDSNAQAGAIAAQAQGQQQGQSSNNYNKNNVSNYNGNSNNNTSNSNAHSGSVSGSRSSAGAISGSQATGGNGYATGGKSSSNSFSGGNSQRVGNESEQTTEIDTSNALENENAASNTTNVIYKRNPVSSAMAAALVAGNDACMGSVSAGAQGVGFGASIGKTYTDESCVRRKDARTLHVLGFGSAGVALLCQDDAIAKAMNDAGTPCTWAEQEHVSVNKVTYTYEEDKVIKSGIFKGAVADYPTSR